MNANMLVIHGGGPTAVINSSLYGVIKEAKKNPVINKVYGAIGGTEAVLKEQFLDMKTLSQEQLKLLLQTPASAIGTSRYPLAIDDYSRMIEIFKKNHIKYVLLNGGNGTMDTCGKLSKVCKEEGIYVIGIPKTIDNDIASIDHSPGYGSAARYMATTVAEIGADVKSLPIHICIIEAMGRNAGWITAASALARAKEGDAPHLIYLPEKPFDEISFLEDVKRLYNQLGGVVVVVSEGLKGKDGNPIVPPLFQSGRATYYGDVSAYLCNLVIKELGIKARSEKPGLSGRASIALQSKLDRDEAILVGEFAVKAAIEGKTGMMVGINRAEGNDYHITLGLIPIDKVMLHERLVPDHYMNERGNDVTKEFVEWCKPLVGEALTKSIDLQEMYWKGETGCP